VCGFSAFSFATLDLFCPQQIDRLASRGRKEQTTMAWFYEILSSDNAALNRNGGFATQDAAKIAGREDAKKMKNSRQPDSSGVGRIMVGRNADKLTRW
jgi:hypothetical protein